MRVKVCKNGMKGCIALASAHTPRTQFVTHNKLLNLEYLIYLIGNEDKFVIPISLHATHVCALCI